MAAFKVGDLVKVRKDCSDVPANMAVPLYDKDGDGNLWAKSPDPDSSGCNCEDNWILIETASVPDSIPVGFILEYLTEDNAHRFRENCATMQEVEARIKELAKRPDLKRESIKVYEVAKTYEVSLDTRVTLKATGAVEKAPVKRGRPRKVVATPAKKRGRPKGSKNKK